MKGGPYLKPISAFIEASLEPMVFADDLPPTIVFFCNFQVAGGSAFLCGFWSGLTLKVFDTISKFVGQFKGQCSGRFR